MPSSPRIPKEIILEYALKMLIREGYAAINIKALAKEIGCSTQPISWHFGNMEGLRRELAEYAMSYADRKMCFDTDGMEAFSHMGIAYLDMAFDEPNLFRYLNMNNDRGYFVGGFDAFIAGDENAAMIERIAGQLGISGDKVGAYYRNMIIYTHGLASLIASGLVKATKEETRQMMKRASEGFLLQAGSEQPGGSI